MKKFGLLCIILVLALLLVPLVRFHEIEKTSVISVAGSVVDAPPPAKKATAESFRLYRAGSGKIVTLSADEYICGVVSAEMPASYESEALKAQAVAAYTFACRRKANSSDKKYDISDDCSVDQAYRSKAECYEKWGKNADLYWQKIHDAVAAVIGEMVLYDGRAALTAYHAISSGKTESSENVWGGKVPYLIPVSSEADRLASGYQKTATFSEKTFVSKLSGLTSFKGQPQNYVGKITRTSSGTVKKIVLCGKTVSGGKVYGALGLRSGNFEIVYKNHAFQVTTYGFGHGVGMSQNGANEMAKQGSTYREILCWYYPGCTVEKV